MTLISLAVVSGSRHCAGRSRKSIPDGRRTVGGHRSGGVTPNPLHAPKVDPLRYLKKIKITPSALQVDIVEANSSYTRNALWKIVFSPTLGFLCILMGISTHSNISFAYYI